MNIMTIGTTDALGGAAKVSRDIMDGLKERGHTVSFFVADKTSDDPAIRVIPRSMVRKYLGFLLGTESLIATDWLLSTEEFRHADVIHCHNIHGRFFNLSTLQKMSRVKPVVWTLHDEWALTPHCAYTLEGTQLKNGLYVCPSIDAPPRILWDNTARLTKVRARIYERSVLHIVTPSQWLKERAEKTLLAKHDIQLIPNGIDSARFVQIPKNDARERLGLPFDKKIVLFLANDAKDNPWKGWEYTAQIIARYRHDPTILFLCVGNLRDHTPEPSVRYIGHVRGAEALSLYYSAADLLLFTSIAENFPLVILEAMSCGLPIIAFDVGGVREEVTHEENGYIAQYRDIEDLARGVSWALGVSEEERVMIASRSSEKVREQYDQSPMVQRYVALYESLL